MTTLSNLVPIESFISESYNASQNHLRELWFISHKMGFSYAIFDAHQKQVMYFNRFEVADFFEISSNTFQELLDGIDVFLNDFKSIKILFENVTYTLMPAALFDEEEALPCYELKYSLGTNERLLNQRIPDFGAQIIYAIPEFMLNILLSKFTESSLRERIKIFHHVHALLSGLYYQTNHLNKEVCYVNLSEKTFDIVLIKNSSLHFCNTYLLNNPEDVLYFMMHAYQNNQLNPEIHECYLSGTNTQIKIIKELLYTYIKNIKPIELSNKPSSELSSSNLFLLQHCV